MPRWLGWQCIYNDNWSVEFKNIVRKRLPFSVSLVEDTMQEVRQELAISLTTLDSSPDSVNAYLRTAFRNTLEDYLRKKQGYPRPPQWIKRLGASYERIYKLLCLENRSVNDIHASMASLYKHTREFIEKVISEVRAGVVNCGSWRETVSGDDALNEIDSSEKSQYSAELPDEWLQQFNSTALFKIILGEATSLPDTLQNQSIKSLFENLQKYPLQDDERLLLRMVFTDGYSVSAAARLLGMEDKKARKQLNTTLNNLRDILQAAGITGV